MRYYFPILAILFLLSACVENTIDSEQAEKHGDQRKLRSILTKSFSFHQEDSLTIMSKLQSDVDNLMMGRVIQQDSIFILAIKREDALFLGVSAEIYDKYMDYVDRLNEQLFKR